MSKSNPTTKSAMATGLRLAAEKGKNATEWAGANPRTAVAVGAGVVLVAAPMLIAAPLLGAFGFGANGIVVGSMAAGAQSGIGSVVAPSLFATLQSAGAGGYGVAAVAGAFQGLGAVIGSSGALSVFRKAKKAEDGEEKEDEDEDGEKDGASDEDDDEVTSKL
ncbi:hypothetical protein F4802DRAFT_574307 [Xylaria palmicola]|nr:hypothetical protein F4802DRAFT_574307 [Xylaria palmicola]